MQIHNWPYIPYIIWILQQIFSFKIVNHHWFTIYNNTCYFPIASLNVRIALHLWWFSNDGEKKILDLQRLTLAVAKLRYQAIFNPQICIAFVHSLCLRTLSAIMDLVGSLTSPLLFTVVNYNYNCCQLQLWHGRKCRRFQSVQNAAYQFNSTVFRSDHSSAQDY